MRKSLLFIGIACIAPFISSAQQHPHFLDSLTLAMQQGKYPNIDDIVIAQNNKIIYEKYYNGQKKDEFHDSRSSFKSVTALLMGIAIDKGIIKSVKEKVYSFFPEYKSYANWDNRKKDMTIEDLLEMKSGFDCEEWNGTKDCEAAMTPTDDWVKFSLDLPLKYSPGTKWDYTSCNPMIISGIISNATHMPLPDFAAKYLFEPLGIKKYQWTKDKHGHAMTAGSFYISPTEYIKIGEMVLQKGLWNNKRIVSEAWLNRATERITKIENFSNIAISRTKAAIPQPTWYGYYWYNEEINTGKLKYNVVFASGNGGQYIMIIKELKLVVLFNGNSYDSWKSKLQFELLAKYILPSFTSF